MIEIIVMHMKKLMPLLMSTVFCVVGGCAEPNVATNKCLPYCFLEETQDNRLPEAIEHISVKYIKENKVLLFPVVTRGVISGKKVDYGLGSPMVYKQGEDLSQIRFKGVDRWPVRRYMVWARGYYIQSIPRMFLYSGTINGRPCSLVELTPIKPGTDQKKMEDAIINELKKGKIVVEDGVLNVADVTDYAHVIKAEELRSWIKDTMGYQSRMGVWEQSGATVEILLTLDDYILIESYLRGDAFTPNGLKS